METSIFEFGSNIFSDGLIYFLIRTAFIVLFAWLLNKLICRGIGQVIHKERAESVTAKYITRIVTAVIYIIAAFSILSAIVPLKGLGTAVLGATSVFSVIIGLAAQESFGNFIAGFFLALSQPFCVGDLVTLPEKNISGVVQEITFRHTVLQTVENTQMIIPNSIMNTAILENKVFGQSTYTRFINVTIGYDSDVELARRIITKIVMHTDGIIDMRSQQEIKEGKNPFNIRVADFQASGVQLIFPVNTKDLSSSLLAASDIRIAILKEFKENQIEIPYNKVQVIQ